MRRNRRCLPRVGYRAACGALLGACLLGLGDGAAHAQSPIVGASAGHAANGVGSPFELTFWQSVATSEDQAQYEAYLMQYPQGTFSALARAKIAALGKGRSAAPLPPPIPAPASVQAVAPEASAPIPVAGTAIAAAPIASPPAPAAAVSPAPAFVPPEAAQPVAALPATAAAPAPAPIATTLPAVTPNPAPAPVSAAPPMDAFAKMAAAQQGRTAPMPEPALPVAAPARPARPQLAPVPAVALPDRFCSAEERNRFHDTVYKPAVALADQNNQAAIAYLGQLQADYDDRSGKREIERANLIAREAGDYKAIAQEAYAARNAFVGLFDRMMTVPVTTCP